MHGLLDKIRQFCNDMGNPTAPIVLAVSGGADSVALMRGVIALKIGPVLVGHLNHQLRGAESDLDESFVEKLCWKLRDDHNVQIDYRGTQVNVAEQAGAAGDNLENTARQVRYAWLAQLAAEHHAGFVFTGHTADDQAETILHRLLRGTGIKGLRGIAERRPLRPGVELVRPMLQVTRAEVLAYLHEIGQDFREDQSNLDPRFTRNRIRHHLLPLLAQEYNPAIVSLLGRLARQADEANQELDKHARQLLEAVELPATQMHRVFDRARLGNASVYLVREMFRLVWEREGWPMGEMGAGDWDRITHVAQGKLPAIDVPGRLRVEQRERVIVIGTKES